MNSIIVRFAIWRRSEFFVDFGCAKDIRLPYVKMIKWYGDTHMIFSKLFIIGNGFDLDHRFSTKYSDFRNWMEDNLGKGNQFDDVNLQESDPPYIPSVIQGNHGEDIVEEAEAIQYLMWLLYNNIILKDDADWNRFEEALYYLDLDEVISTNIWRIEDSFRDRDGDINYAWEMESYDNYASDIKIATEYIHKLFEKWIDQVDISLKAKKQSVADVLAEGTLFLSFNYTETLEKVYGISPKVINHIHGIRRKAFARYGKKGQSAGLVIGHGIDKERDFNPEHLEAELQLQETIRALRKNTDAIISNNREFWSMISNSKIKDIYSYGFSYNDVDLDYILEIIKAIHGGKDVTWYLTKFDDINGNTVKYETIIRRCGFLGSFGLF